MAVITTRQYPISPTLRWTTQDGRLTSEGFRLLKALADIAEFVTIQDGEVTAGKIAAGAINATNIIVENIIVTGQLTANSVTDITVAAQASAVGPDGNDVVEATVPVTGTGNTGVLINFTGFMDRPTTNASNFGYWRVRLERNGTEIDSTPSLFYDDNFAYPVVAAFADETPGTDPVYTISTVLTSGLGLFTISEGLLVCSLFKR